MSLLDQPNILPLEGEIDLHVSPRRGLIWEARATRGFD